MDEPLLELTKEKKQPCFQSNERERKEKKSCQGLKHTETLEAQMDGGTQHDQQSRNKNPPRKEIKASLSVCTH